MERPSRLFWFKLACRLGIPVGELQGRITSSEYSEWLAYYTLEPWGEDRADLRAGIVASTIANVHRRSNSKTYSATDFMPRYGEGGQAGRVTDVETIYGMFRAMCGGENGNDCDTFGGADGSYG